VKEGSTKRQSAVWVFISGGVLIAAAIIALYTPWFGICDVREVVITGNRRAEAAELVALSQLHRGQTIFSIPAQRIRRQLETHPWVKEASVKRIFPHTIALEIVERPVVAWCQSGVDDKRVAIAEGGVVVEDADVLETTLQVMGARSSGWEPGDKLLDPGVAELLDLLADGVCGVRVQKVDVTDLRSIELFLENDVRVRLGDLSLVSARLAAVTALCQAIESDGYETIDVRFGGEATLVPRKAVRR
jgi:cell division septal protein FtsQ